MEETLTRRQQYKLYLKGPVWKAKRDACLEEWNHECAICGSKRKSLHVHHRFYPEVYGEEPLKWLIVLCESCHSLFHGKLSRRRAKIERERLEREAELELETLEGVLEDHLRSGLTEDCKRIEEMMEGILVRFPKLRQYYW